MLCSSLPTPSRSTQLIPPEPAHPCSPTSTEPPGNTQTLPIEQGQQKALQAVLISPDFATKPRAPWNRTTRRVPPARLHVTARYRLRGKRKQTHPCTPPRNSNKVISRWQAGGHRTAGVKQPPLCQQPKAEASRRRKGTAHRHASQQPPLHTLIATLSSRCLNTSSPPLLTHCAPSSGTFCHKTCTFKHHPTPGPEGLDLRNQWVCFFFL